MKILLTLFLIITLNSNVLGDNYRPKIGTDIARILLNSAVVIDIIVDGPHPDVDKCICKGTGLIKQGDGHTTKCPYHGKKGEEPIFQEVEVKEEVVMPVKKPKPKFVNKKSKYVIYHLGTRSCGPCIRMKNNVWPHKKVVELLAKEDIKLIILEGTNDKHRKYFSFYQDKRFGFPQVVLVDRADLNNPVLHIIGYADVKSLVKKIEDAIDD